MTEKEEEILMGVYNINVLNSDVNNQASDFLDTMYSNSLSPAINTSTRILATSRTSVDIICDNEITKNITSVNITTSISDHLTQYLIVTNKHSDVPLQTKREFYFYKNFKNNNLKDEIDLVDWEDFLKILKQNLNFSLVLFNRKIESLLKTYYPKTTVSNDNLKE